MAAIERHERDKRYGDAVTARMAQADGKAWRTYMARLKRGS